MLRAQQADVVRPVIPSHGEGVPVVKLEPVPLGAAPALLVHEAAPLAIALAYRTAHRGRDVARGWPMCLFPRASCAATTVLPKRRASSRSSLSVTARSMTAARSPSGTSVRRSAVSRSSLSRSSALAVNWTLKRAGASGSTKAVRDGGGRVGRSCGVAAGCVTTRRATSSWGGGSAAEARVGAGTATSEGPCRFCGSFRITEGTSGRGASSATRCSIWRVVRCEARSRSAVQLSAVSSGTSRARPLRWSAAVPERLQDPRLLACRAGYGDAAVGLGLREMQALGAVGEHRREGLTGEEPSLVDLADVSDEIGLDAARPERRARRGDAAARRRERLEARE